MGMREWEIPAAKIPGQKIDIVDGKQQFTPTVIGLADFVLTDVLSQPDLLKTVEGIDLVMTLNPILQPLRGDAGAGKKVRQSEAQWELLKQRMATAFQRGIPPEAQLPIAEAFRAVLTAKVVTD